MRKVKFKKWISLTDNPSSRVGKWENDFINQGIFHKWGNAYEEFENGPGNYTVAIVELPNGEIAEVLPMNLKFVKDVKEVAIVCHTYKDYKMWLEENSKEDENYTWAYSLENMLGKRFDRVEKIFGFNHIKDIHLIMDYLERHMK